MDPKVPQGGAPDASDQTPPAGDDLKNVKAEFNRKIGNLEETNKQLLAQLKNLTEVVKPAKAPAEPSKKVSVFDDEEAYATRIKEEAAAEIERKLEQQQAQQAKQAQVINSLVTDFPELSDGNHDLTKRAVEIFNGLEESERKSPSAYRTAVLSAASEFGMRPKSKRTSSSDDSFALGGGGGESRASKRSAGEISEGTKTFAALVGLDLDDPKNKASADRIKTKHGRKSYSKWG